MDAVVVILFVSVAALGAIFAKLFNSIALGGLSAVALVLIGLTVVTAGLDTQPYYTTTTNFNASDQYVYSWNTTYNTTRLDTVNTNLNKSITQNFGYWNAQDNNSRFFGIILIMLGLIIGFETNNIRAKQNEARLNEAE